MHGAAGRKNGRYQESIIGNFHRRYLDDKRIGPAAELGLDRARRGIGKVTEGFTDNIDVALRINGDAGKRFLQSGAAEVGGK